MCYPSHIVQHQQSNLWNQWWHLKWLHFQAEPYAEALSRFSCYLFSLPRQNCGIKTASILEVFGFFGGGFYLFIVNRRLLQELTGIQKAFYSAYFWYFQPLSPEWAHYSVPHSQYFSSQGCQYSSEQWCAILAFLKLAANRSFWFPTSASRGVSQTTEPRAGHWGMLMGRSHGFARSIFWHSWITDFCAVSLFFNSHHLYQRTQPASSSTYVIWKWHYFLQEETHSICYSELLTRFSFHSRCQW